MRELSRFIDFNSLNTAALSVQNLIFAYQKKRPILTGLDLHITEGERVGLIGANGAGKTTLFLTICGILSAKQGEIYIFGRKIQVGRFNPDIGLVFQNPVDQLFCPTVRDDVAFGPENLGLSPLEVNLRVQQALAVTGTSHLIDRIPHHLSGGEKSMVAIASVLSLQPKFILYDEPSANLDLQARRRLINFLQTSPQTILVASHDLEMILEVCDRVLVLNHGTIVADGQPLEIMKNRELMTHNGLEVPKSLG